MTILAAAAVSFQLFAPVIAVGSAAVATLVAQRLMMSRKVRVARTSSDPLLDMSLEDSFTKAASSKRSAPAALLVESPIIALTAIEQPAPREDEVTLRFLRGRRVPSPADSASMTLRSGRVYLETDDLLAV